MNLKHRMYLLAAILAMPLLVDAQALETAKIDEALGRSGQGIGEVYTLGLPRTDLHVPVHTLAIKPGLALGFWAAFLGTDDNAMVMGDLVLLAEELNPLMGKLRAAGFDISAAHNHLIEETPHVFANARSRSSRLATFSTVSPG